MSSEARRTNPFGRRRTKPHRDAVAAGAKPRGDLPLVIEAGIDSALFWNGRGCVVNAPEEER